MFDAWSTQLSKFNYVADGEELTDSDYEWQNNLIKFTQYTVKCKFIMYKRI